MSDADGKSFDPSKYALNLPGLIRGNENALQGRRLILTFKKGGRIKEEHVYYSDDHDWESQYAISMIFMIALQGQK